MRRICRTVVLAGLLCQLSLCSTAAVGAESIEKSCRCVWTSEPPPRGVAEWAANRILNDPQTRESRFVDYDKQSALNLAADATAQRAVEGAGGAQGKPRPTSFSMMYNAEGWYVYIRSEEPDIERIRNLNGAGEALEVFFTPGLGNDPYYMLMIDLAANKVEEYTVGSPHRHYRPLSGLMQVETIPLPGAWGTTIFIPWECLYDKLPANSDTWRFTIVRWMPYAKCGGVSWNGKVHETGRWGLIRWDKPGPENLLAIRKHLVRRAWMRYQAQLSAASGFWNEKELERDAEFYRAAVEPVAQRFSPFAEKIKALDQCDAGTLQELFAHVPEWMEFRYTVDELRREFLTRKLLGETARPADASVQDKAGLACYAVPAISPLQRLPDAIPADGQTDGRMNVIAAQGEHEAASFVVVSRADADKLEVQPSDLIGDGGTIPATCVDIKVVKCWYQGGTAWHSYFGDPSRRVLVPELLLNDDTLVKVDTEKQDNHLRIDYPEGARYVCVSYDKVDPKAPKFNYAAEPVKDSAALRPVALRAGQARQFWITVKIPAKAAAGVYRGTIALALNGNAAGAVTLNLRVLPFELPDPKTYYSLQNDYYTLMMHHCALDCHMALLNKNAELAEARLRAEYRNMIEHNLTFLHMRLDYNGKNKDLFVRQLQLMKEAGFRMKPLFGGAWACCDYGWMNKPKEQRAPQEFEAFKKRIDETFDLVEQTLGHRDLFANCWDEAGKGTLRGQQDCWRYIHQKGGRIWATSNPNHFALVGQAEDASDAPGISRDKAILWHSIGGRVMTYASPHTGPENPDLLRRTHGLQLYKAHYDGTFNYIWYEGGQNIWNDFVNDTFRCFNLVYPTQNGVIDTLAWEGFREGIDDIRYATKLKLLAEKAIAAGDVDARYEGKRALQWLELMDEKAADLNTVRLEMVNYILKLQRLPGVQ